MSNRTQKYQIKAITEARAYQVLRSPVITEKATMASENNQVIFKVSTCAKKPEIKLAVEKIFSVKVKNVSTLNQTGKTKRFRGIKGFRADTKKAIVTLQDGQTIDMASGA